jgi:hypothetical protein
MALDETDRAEIRALLKAEITKFLAEAGRQPGIDVRYVGIPIDITQLGRAPGRIPGIYTASGSDCCNGCD